jgi:hypothetical protein
MAQPVLQPTRPADDRFARYYAEKLWAWIPEIYRQEDTDALRPGVLRALIDIIGGDAAVARRSVDRLWEDTLIDYADDWAIPYIGDLLGTRILNGLNRRGRRLDVARTVFYRRRAGTPHVLEMLVHDITGWDGAIVESFRRLGRHWHGLDAPPDRHLGKISGTPPGGTANLHSTRITEIVDGPFDDLAHTPDFRRIKGLHGRYNIPKLNIHLFRQRAFAVAFATPFRIAANRYTFDPSGRDRQLFKARQRPGRETWHPIAEWHIQGPFTCRLLNAAVYRLRSNTIPGAWQAGLAPRLGADIEGSEALRLLVERLIAGPFSIANFQALLRQSIAAASPKIHLIPAAVALSIGADILAPLVPHEEILGANLERWDLLPSVDMPPPGVSVLIDPRLGRFLLHQEPAVPQRLFVPVHHYGQFNPAGAGTHDRDDFIEPGGTAFASPNTDPGPIALPALQPSGIFDFADSKTYDAATAALANVTNLRLQARNFTRPYMRVIPPAPRRRLTITAQALNAALPPNDPQNIRTFDLEGVWLGIVPPSATTTAPFRTRLIIDGSFQRVTISNATLDPGGHRARLGAAPAIAIPHIVLVLRGQVDELVIDRSIVGAIFEETTVADPCSVGTVTIRDSIVDGIQSGGIAIETRVGELHIERSTVFGNIRANRLYATETLVQGVVQVADNQHGCFRFSAASAGQDMLLPRQFESHIFAGGIRNHMFVSRRFGDPGYAQLSETAPPELRRGGENTSEIGVFNRFLAPILADDLARKFAEYAPINLISQFINET